MEERDKNEWRLFKPGAGLPRNKMEYPPPVNFY